MLASARITPRRRLLFDCILSPYLSCQIRRLISADGGASTTGGFSQAYRGQEKAFVTAPQKLKGTASIGELIDYGYDLRLLASIWEGDYAQSVPVTPKIGN